MRPQNPIRNNPDSIAIFSTLLRSCAVYYDRDGRLRVQAEGCPAWSAFGTEKAQGRNENENEEAA